MYGISLEQVSLTRIGNGVDSTPGSATGINGNRRTTRLIFLTDQFTRTVIHQNMKITDHTLIYITGSDIHQFLTLHFQPDGSGQIFLRTYSLHILFRLAGTAHSRHRQQRAQHEQHEKHFPAKWNRLFLCTVYSVFK